MNQQQLRATLYDIIFGTESPLGKLFDLVLIYAILISVGAIMLDSVQWGSARLHYILYVIEWVFTGLFTIEYIARIYCSPKPFVYMRSPYGLVDLFSILPSYLALFLQGASYLLIIRLLRVLRIFRILKLVRYLSEENLLMRSMMQSRRKVFVFFCTVLVLASIFGAFMYLVEGPENGYTSIPKSIYVTIVTITTVGYGDITPHTPLGQALAAFTMLLGYSIIAVPTGILTAELAHEMQRDRITRMCSQCNRSGHERDAKFCRFCGSPFPNGD